MMYTKGENLVLLLGGTDEMNPFYWGDIYYPVPPTKILGGTNESAKLIR